MLDRLLIQIEWEFIFYWETNHNITKDSPTGCYVQGESSIAMKPKQIKIGVIQSSPKLVDTIERICGITDYDFEISTEGLDKAFQLGRKILLPYF